MAGSRQGRPGLGSRAPARGRFLRRLCFHTQQAAEKALKSVYLHHRWTFRYIHDLEELITGLRQNGLAVPEDVEEAVILTSYAFEARHPAVGEPVGEEEYKQALGLAERVVRWADLLIEGTAP